MLLSLLMFAWLISCIYIVNGIKYHNNRLIRHHHHKNHHNNLLHRKHQIHHHRHHYDRSNLYHHAKAVDYDKLLEFMEIRDIFEEEMVVPTINQLTGPGSQYHNYYHLNLGGTPPLIGEHPAGHLQIRYPDATAVGGFTVYANLDWHHHKEQIEGAVVTNAEGRAVVKLRAELVDLLLEHVTVTANANQNFKTQYAASTAGPGNPSTVTVQGHDQCFNNLGSTTISSDLDFDYIRWDIPQKVVSMLIEFYTQFRRIFNVWPPTAFDMNFYIATGFAADKHFNADPVDRHYPDQDPEAHDKSCYTDKIHGTNIAGLFNEVTRGATNKDYGTIRLYEFCGNYDNGKYKKHDEYLALYLIRKRAALDVFPEPTTATIKRLIKFSEVFYFVLHLISLDNTNEAHLEIDDGVKLYLKSLRYYINYYSDESYISNEALQSQFGVDFLAGPDHDKQIYLAVLDLFGFIGRYAKSPEVQDEHDPDRKLYIFWQRSCKYIYRIGNLLKEVSDFTDRAPRGPFLSLPTLDIRDEWLINIPERARDSPAAPAQIAGNNPLHYKENLFGWAWVWSTKEWTIAGVKQKIRGDVARDAILAAPATGVGANPMVTQAISVWRALKVRWATFGDLWADAEHGGVLQSVYDKLNAFAIPETPHAEAALKKGMELIKQNIIGTQSTILLRDAHIAKKIVRFRAGAHNLAIQVPAGTDDDNRYTQVRARKYVNVWEDDVAVVSIKRPNGRSEYKKIKKMLLE